MKRRPVQLALAFGSAAVAVLSAVSMTGEVRLVSILVLFFGGFGAGASLVAALTGRAGTSSEPDGVEASALMHRAATARRAGRLEDAYRDYSAAVAAARSRGAARDLLQAVRGLGQIERDMGHGPRAVPLYEEAVAISRALGDSRLLAHTIRHLGDLHQDNGELTLAEPCYREALELYRRLPDTPPGELANALRPMAILAETSRQSADARRLWLEARELYVTVGLPEAVAECDQHLASLDA